VLEHKGAKSWDGAEIRTELQSLASHSVEEARANRSRNLRAFNQDSARYCLLTYLCVEPSNFVTREALETAIVKAYDMAYLASTRMASIPGAVYFEHAWREDCRELFEEI
jgi:hypothetical protein